MKPVLHFATFLSPNLYRTHEYIASYIGEKLGYSTLLTLGDKQSLEGFDGGKYILVLYVVSPTLR